MRAVPDNVRKLRGTDRADRPDAAAPQLDFQPLTKAPEAPDWLSVHAAAYWRKVSKLLVDAGALTSGDLEALETLCLLYGKIRAAQIGELSVNAATLTQLRMYQAEFGLTPAGRARMNGRGGPAEGGGGKKQGRFSSNRPRARAR